MKRCQINTILIEDIMKYIWDTKTQWHYCSQNALVRWTTAASTLFYSVVRNKLDNASWKYYGWYRDVYGWHIFGQWSAELTAPEIVKFVSVQSCRSYGASQSPEPDMLPWLPSKESEGDRERGRRVKEREKWWEWRRGRGSNWRGRVGEWGRDREWM